MKLHIFAAIFLSLFFSGCLETAPQDTSQTAWISYSPIQCKQNPWEVWEANSGRVYIRAPTEQEILASYYSQVYGVQISNYTRRQNGGAVCAACNCPRGDTITVQIYANDSQKMISLGWNLLPDPDYECPEIMPPSPSFCENGTIVSGGTDEHGCQLPPKCNLPDDGRQALPN